MPRAELINQLFPRGVPRLWCPTITHFEGAGKPNRTRIEKHLGHLSPHVQGILVPGSTGEGWEMSDADIRRILDITLDAAHSYGMVVLIGVLKTNPQDVLNCFATMETCRQHPSFAGFTVCPSKGSELSQSQISEDLKLILQQGYPTALYQLPQVTQNEMEATTVQNLTAEFPNIILFKDTSGEDRVAYSGLDFQGVFMVRGSESGGYAHWLRAARGPYDGYLLSTANVFAEHLSQIIDLTDSANIEEAHELSDKLETVVTAVFEQVRGFAVGNAFANANKTLDHVMAFGDRCLDEPPPLLFSGVRLPKEYIAKTRSLLENADLMPSAGYMFVE